MIGSEIYLFEKYYDVGLLSSVIESLENYIPFPVIENREGWCTLSDEIKQKIVKDAEQYVGYELKQLTASMFMLYYKNGDRVGYEKVCFERRTVLCSLVMAECVENQGRFLERIADIIWAICEETSWCIPAHNYMHPVLDIKKYQHKQEQTLPDINRPVFDLFAGETAGTLSWTIYLLGSNLNKISPIIVDRAKQEIEIRVIRPFLEHDTYWWMGFVSTLVDSVNNWNPWCSFNVLSSLLLTEKDEHTRMLGISKVIRVIDKFVTSYSEDGGCDEGPNYWHRAGGSLFDCLELLYGASNGKLNLFEFDKVKEIGRYIYRVQISNEYFVNFADSSAKCGVFASRAYLFGARIKDEYLQNLGVEAFQDEERKYAGGKTLYHRLLSTFLFDEMNKQQPDYHLINDVWLKDIQVMCVREENGFFLAAKGGNNGESHNHNDIGSFIVYFNGNPIIIDAGVASYTRKTFSDERYEIWTMRSLYHNVPFINGCEQKDGAMYKADNVKYKCDEKSTALTMDIKKAYPDEAMINSWVRNFKFYRDDGIIEIYDEFELKELSSQIIFHFLTAVQPVCINNVLLLGNEVCCEYDSNKVDVDYEMISMDDEQLKHNWGDNIYRVSMKLKCFADKGDFKLIIKQQ